MTDDQTMLRAVHDMWQTLDPMPADLVDRVLFTLQLEGLEFELMRLQDALAPVGARGPETASTVTFSAESLTVMVTVSESGPHRRRIDGWIAPGGALRVELRTTRGVHETHADSDGRFAFSEVPSGLVQIMIHPTVGATVPLHRAVVTPPVQL